MRFLPQSLFGRLLLFLTGGLTIAQLLSAAILLQDREQALYHALGGHAAQRITAIVNLLDTLDDAERQRLVTALDLPPTHLSLDVPWQPESAPDDRYQATLFRALLIRQLGSKLPFQVKITGDLPPPPPPPPPIDRPLWQLAAQPPPPRDWAEHPPHRRMRELMLGLRNFVVQVRLHDGAVATFQQVLPEEVIAWPVRLLLILSTLLVSVAVLAAWAVRALTRPLAVLADAATELGRNIRRPPLAERGPLEVRRAAQAFNTMQDRLIRYIQDRDRILAAISHDLKTPITRLRLRAEMLDDSPLREKFQADLDDMQHMAQASLDFLRGGENSEPMAPIDLNALLESLQEDAEDIEREVRIEGAAEQPLRCRPLALKRCLTNLIDNALKYGQDAVVVVMDSPTRLALAVRDHGPGIPEAELSRVFEPFYRLETSRSRDTGGTGLGLSIARNIARAHGGELTLRNLPQGGLEALLELPR
ncbi:MAG TPA: ATP-binding protein [Candidatus Competibacteraceae bacterium]|nr:ATP-binding protein [Candidatus Competibacteraceae bacterium]HQA24946.1 ATP-binding protein [Candidatus Competibacteraceae bacterium]HQD54971.1 ATP-binding protein [Candidatus Competibacteraceae bacterium]